MPLNAVNMVTNGWLRHQDIRQFIDLLTGIMSDQLVSISNSVVATGLVRGSQLQSTTGDVLMGNVGVGLYTFGGNDIYANTNGNFNVRSRADGHLSFVSSVGDNRAVVFGRLVTNNWDYGWSNSLGGNTIMQGRLVTNTWDSGYDNNLGGTRTAINERLYVWDAVQAMRKWADLSGNDNAFIAPNIGDNRGQMLAYEYRTWACVDHAEAYGLRLNPMPDALKMVNAITGYSYEHLSFFSDAASSTPHPVKRTDGRWLATPTYGFKASEVAEYLPELVGRNPRSGEPEAVDLGRMVVILWEAVKTLSAQLDMLKAIPNPPRRS